MPNTIPSFRNVSVSDIVAITLLVPSPEATEKMTMREVENAFGPALDRCVDLICETGFDSKAIELEKEIKHLLVSAFERATDYEPPAPMTSDLPF